METTQNRRASDPIGRRGPAIRWVWFVLNLLLGLVEIVWIDEAILRSYGAAVAASTIGSEVEAVVASAAVFALLLAYEQNRSLKDLLDRIVSGREPSPTPVGEAPSVFDTPSIPKDVEKASSAPAPPASPPARERGANLERPTDQDRG